MEAPAARKREYRPQDSAARRFDRLERFFQIFRIEDRQRLGIRLGLETAIQTFFEGGIARPVIGERPAEGTAVEGFHAVERAAGRREFEIVQLSCLAHAVLLCSLFVLEHGRRFCKALSVRLPWPREVAHDMTRSSPQLTSLQREPINQPACSVLVLLPDRMPR